MTYPMNGAYLRKSRQEILREQIIIYTAIRKLVRCNRTALHKETGLNHDILNLHLNNLEYLQLITVDVLQGKRKRRKVLRPRKYYELARY